jgi:hypothetical protein
VATLALRSFLIPPQPEPDLGTAFKAASAALAAYEAFFLFLPDWRTRHLAFCPTPPAPHPLAASLLDRWQAELAANQIFLGPPATPPAWPDLDVLPPSAPVLPISFPLASPEALVDLGQTMALAASEARVAVVGFGYIGGPKAPLPARQRLTDEVVALFTAGRGHQLPNLDMDLWLAGRPHQDLAHLFVFLGSAGGTTAAEVLGRSEGGAGSAVVLDLDPRHDAPDTFSDADPLTSAEP